MKVPFITLLAIFSIACADSRVRRPADSGAGDTSVTDSGAVDARPDSGGDSSPPMDATVDAADTSPLPDVGLDTVADTSPPLDTTPDAVVFDVGPDAPTRLIIESATFSIEDSAGVTVDETFYQGWRFEVPASGLEVDRVGFYGWMPNPGTLFAAIVVLSGSSDVPDMPDLSGTDVIATALEDPGAVSFRAWIDIEFAISASLSPGWHAVLFGSNAFGADPMANGNIQNMTGARTPGAQGIFTIRQSDGMVINQAGTKRVFVEGLVP